MKRSKRYIDPVVEEDEERKREIETVIRDVLKKELVLINIAQLLRDVKELKRVLLKNG